MGVHQAAIMTQFRETAGELLAAEEEMEETKKKGERMNLFHSFDSVLEGVDHTDVLLVPEMHIYICVCFKKKQSD